jgi:hypothetical protein
MMKLIDCEGCAERREKIKAHMKAITEWIKNPAGSPNPLPLPLSIKLPPTPQIIKSKKELPR